MISRKTITIFVSNPSWNVGNMVFFLVRTGGDATMRKIGTAYAFISKLRGGMQSLKGDYHTKYGGIWINPME